MSKKPLPPPPGFRRLKKTDGQKVRFVYELTGRKGKFAGDWHDAVRLALEDSYNTTIESAERQKQSALRISTWRKYSRVKKGPGRGWISKEVMYYPIFFRRDPLEQVLEHMIATDPGSRRRGRYFLKVDIKNAFGAIQPETSAVSSAIIPNSPYKGWPFFHRNGHGLIQGAPASPILFDTYCRQSGFDDFLREYARRHDLVVTRYVDDIVFSSNRPFSRRSLRFLREQFGKYGFTINDKKSGKFNTAKQRVEFLGVSLYRGRVVPRPRFYERMAELGALPGSGRMAWMQRIEEVNQIVRDREYEYQRQVDDLRTQLMRATLEAVD